MDFHPNMLGQQPLHARPAQAPRRIPGLVNNQLAGMGAIETPPASAHALPGGMHLDAASGTLWVGNSPIKLVPAIVSALAIKLIFFGGEKAGAAMRHGVSRLRGAKTATNPRESAKPWQVVFFDEKNKWKKVAIHDVADRDAAKAKAAEHDGKTRISYVG